MCILSNNESCLQGAGLGGRSRGGVRVTVQGSLLFHSTILYLLNFLSCACIIDSKTNKCE